MDENLTPVGRSQWWILFLLGRVISYALLGGLVTAVVGALLVAGAGRLTGEIINKSVRYLSDYPDMGAFIGLALGGVGGGLSGAVMMGIGALFDVQGRRPWPPRWLLIPTLHGMALGVVGVMGSLLGLFGAASLVMDGFSFKTFGEITNDFLLLLMFGVPVVMMCGGVAGAICGMRRKVVHAPKQSRAAKRSPLWAWEQEV